MGDAGALRPSIGVCARTTRFRTLAHPLRHPQHHASIATTTSSFPDIGKGGNFYLQVNGRDFLVRGGDYTPDLLFRYDPEREADILRYAKDLGINFLRWESKISSEHIVELADEEGIPLMFGWMCCNQWESWHQWSEEDQRVAPESLRSQILMLRPHASVFVWANGSDGLPAGAHSPAIPSGSLRPALAKRRGGHGFGFRERTGTGNKLWDGIRMEGPYCWRPPNYWFSGKYPASIGSNVEQGRQRAHSDFGKP